MRLFFLLHILALLSIQITSLSAAEPDSISTRKSFGFTAGYLNMGSVDELYAPLNYSGSTFIPGLRFSKSKPGYNSELRYRFALLKRYPLSLANRTGAFEEGNANIVKNSFIFEAYDSRRFQLFEMDKAPFRIFASGTWFTNVNLISNYRGVPELLQSGISLGGYAEYSFRKHLFAISVETPFLAWTVRNSYSMSFTQDYEKLNILKYILTNSRLQFPDNNTGIYTGLTWQYSLSGRFSLLAGYHFRYLFNKDPFPLRSVSGITSLSINYTR